MVKWVIPFPKEATRYLLEPLFNMGCPFVYYDLKRPGHIIATTSRGGQLEKEGNSYS